MANFLCLILGHKYSPYRTRVVGVQERDCQRCTITESYYHDPSLAIMLDGETYSADDQVLAASIEDLGLSARPLNALRRRGTWYIERTHGTDRTPIKTIGDLVALTREEALDTINFGKGSLREVEEALRKVGLTLAGDRRSGEDRRA